MRSHHLGSWTWPSSWSTWRALALLEAGKGCLALAGIILVAAGLWQWPAHIVRAEHLLAGASWTSHGLLIAAAGGYAVLRFIEAAGLWWERAWARWTSVFGYTAAIAMQLWQLAHTPSWGLVALLSLSFAILLGLALRALRS
jgi:uncharacterized membrane protein (DUF2068 family)